LEYCKDFFIILLGCPAAFANGCRVFFALSSRASISALRLCDDLHEAFDVASSQFASDHAFWDALCGLWFDLEDLSGLAGTGVKPARLA
jgi:hypothetical protein